MIKKATARAWVAEEQAVAIVILPPFSPNHWAARAAPALELDWGRLIGLSRALDLILTGRPVEAHEALQMGLVNRVVPKGKARESAVKLARQIAAFPQTCLRGDRLSAIEQFDLTFKQAMANEFQHGLQSLAKEAESGALRFAGGAGRHGYFEASDTDQ